MNQSFPMPPILSGSPEKQLDQLRDYLVRVARQNDSGSKGANVEAASVPSRRIRTASPSGTEKTEADLSKEIEDARNRAAQLKQLIIKTADKQQADKEELQTAIDSVEGTTLLHIDSSRGTVFKHSTVETVLRVVLFRGGQKIEDAQTMHEVFGASARLQWSWQRLNEDRYGVISADDTRLSDEGFTFTLTPADVDTKVTFRCELIIE